MEKWLFGGLLGAIVISIGSSIHEGFKEAQLEAGRRSGRIPPRWTDKNRWERD